MSGLVGFGAWLRTAREHAGLSQREMARALGVSHVYVSEVERGNRPPFAEIHAGPLAEALNLGQRFAYHLLRLAAATWRARGAAERLRQAADEINAELAVLGYRPYNFTITERHKEPEIH